MTFDDDLNACAASVEKGDPARFGTVMAAPLSARAKLFPLYAFNVEVSRAPWLTQEPMIAEMRLQWWRDALEEIATGAAVRKHQVVTPLAKILTPEQAAKLDELVALRRWDCYKDAFEDQAHLERYLRSTSGTLMQTAAQLLGHDSPAAAEAGYGLGIANWLRAIPALEAQGRIPLVDGSVDGVRALAQAGQAALRTARSMPIPRHARPAFWPATGIARTLEAATRKPHCVADGMLPEPPRLTRTFRMFFGMW